MKLILGTLSQLSSCQTDFNCFAKNLRFAVFKGQIELRPDKASINVLEEVIDPNKLKVEGIDRYCKFICLTLRIEKNDHNCFDQRGKVLRNKVKSYLELYQLQLP